MIEKLSGDATGHEFCFSIKTSGVTDFHVCSLMRESIFVLIYIKATLVDRPQRNYIAKHAKEL